MSSDGTIVNHPLSGNGDFRSEECIEILKEADIVVTNPPFSLFREYVTQLVDYNKQFLIIGSMNAITYKDIFKLIKNNKLWIGISPSSMDFMIPSGGLVTVNACWYTNLNHRKRNEKLNLYKSYHDNEDLYPRYDNYNAINIDKTKDIPCDFEGTMGVPISFLDKYNPEQFELLGCSYDYGRPEGWDKNINMSVSVCGKNVYKRILIKNKNPHHIELV
jgi:hypothetical protein